MRRLSEVLLSFSCDLLINLPVLPRSITCQPPFTPLGPEALLPRCLAPGLSHWRFSDGCASGALCGRWAQGYTHSDFSSQSEGKMSDFAFKQRQQSQACRMIIVLLSTQESWKLLHIIKS